MGRQAELVILAHFHSIDEQDFQQGKIQLEEHIQHATPYQ